MAEKLTPQGLVVGMIPDEPQPQTRSEQETEQPRKGRKPKNTGES